MDMLGSIFGCMGARHVVLTNNKHQPGPEGEKQRIIDILLTTEKSGKGLKRRLEDDLHVTGWTEAWARLVLEAVEQIVRSGHVLGGVLKEACEKARGEAESFAREHPVYTAAIVTVVAIGVLVILLPWVVEALGFAELGPVEGSYAAWWQATFPDAEAGSFFAYLQRMGMIWGKH